MAPGDPPTYTTAAVTLHWLVAACLVASVILGRVFAGLEDSDPTSPILSAHKSIGLVILLLALARLAWRARHRPPPLPAMPPAHRFAAKLTHALLYVTIVGMPVTGYVAVAARGRETTFFGLFQIPQLTPLSRVLSQNAQTVHTAWQYALYGLVTAHVAAALYHHFILKDGLMARMWPQRQT